MKRYYETEEEFKETHIELKFLICPHCRLIGFLILHGYLYGYAERGVDIIKRGHRIYCSNRGKKRGCGRTFSILISEFIKKFTISAQTLWCFLKKISEGVSTAFAFRETGSQMGKTSPYRLLRKFRYNQSRIRTYLTRVKDPPVYKNIKDSVIETIHHLKSVFQESPCPVSEFQHHFQASFL